MSRVESLLHIVGAASAAFIGVLFFFIMVGVFGLHAAIAGLIVFIAVAFVIFFISPIDSVKI